MVLVEGSDPLWLTMVVVVVVPSGRSCCNLRPATAPFMERCRKKKKKKKKSRFEG